MTHLTPIFAVWDHNAEAMAKDIGETGVVVRLWRHRNSIPSKHWQKIITAAATRGEALTLDQFLAPAETAPVAPDRVLICETCEEQVTPDRVCPNVDCEHRGKQAA